MEFTKDIYFNDSLTSGKIATITYSGGLFQSGSEYVNLVCGFGENWDYTTTLPMTKTENGFTADIEMKDYGVFNFCFSNENNNWDNNNNCNYISPILPKVTEENEINETNIDYGTDYSGSIDAIIEDILGNTVQNDLSNDETNSVDKILESIHEESLPEIEELFTELFSAEFDHPQSTQEIKQETEKNESSSYLYDETNAQLIKLFDELFSSNTNVENVELAQTVTADNASVEDIAYDFTSETIGNTVAETITSNVNSTLFDLDNLVSDLLEPVVASQPATNVEPEISLFDDIKDHEDDEEETALTVIDSNDLLVSSRRLGSFYRFKKRIKIACYKLFVKMPAQFLKDLGFGRN